LRTQDLSAPPYGKLGNLFTFFRQNLAEKFTFAGPQIAHPVCIPYSGAMPLNDSTDTFNDSDKGGLTQGGAVGDGFRLPPRIVWRDEKPGDHGCVTQQAAADNLAAASRRIG
jgi:hypothetical protein